MKIENLQFFLPMIPPTVTQQEHKVTVVKGKPRFYEPEELKAARAKITDHLAQYVPEEKFAGAVKLHTMWIWPSEDGKVHFKTTKPDTDNLIKMLKDCMTRCGFWQDDAQVVVEITEKYYGSVPGIWVDVKQLEENQ